jgi:hypothetical protein
MNSPAAGWHPDPTGRHEYRYWDGTDWTGDVSDHGTTAFDPIGTAPPAGAGPSPGDAPTTIDDATRQFGPQPGGYGTEPTGVGSEPTSPFGTQPTGFGPQPGGYGSEPTGFGPQPGGHGPGPGSFGAPPGDYSGQFPPGPPGGSGSRSGMVAVVVGILVVALIILGGGALALFSSDSGSDDDSETAETTVAPDDPTTSTAAPSTTTATTAPPTTAGPEDANVFTLEVGDCLVDDTAEGEVREVPVVPCDQPHTSEIYYSHTLSGDTLPSQSEMEDIVDAECVSRFEGFVGIPYPDSALLVTWLEPTPGSWAAGDRELLCLASGPAGEVVGTLEGSNR